MACIDSSFIYSTDRVYPEKTKGFLPNYQVCVQQEPIHSVTANCVVALLKTVDCRKKQNQRNHFGQSQMTQRIH